MFPNVSNRLAYRYQCFLPRGFGAWLRTTARHFDVAHLHACRNVPGALAAAHLRRAGVPYIVGPNGTAPNIERRTAAKHVFDAVAGRRMLRHAARVLAVTEAERSQLRALGVADARIRVVPNPVDVDEFQSVNAVHPRTRGTDGPRVVYLGQISPRKRVDLLVRAFAQLEVRDATLVIGGNDMGGAAAAKAAAIETGVSNRTVFAGLLRGRARLDLLAQADVVVYPSEHEIFGLVPLEALLAGTPVIVADDSGCGEVVRAVGGGLVVPGTVADVAAALRRVLAAPGPWREAAHDAAVRVRARYAPGVVCDALERVYREVAAA